MAIRAAATGGRAWSDALLGRPWLLVAAAALFIALPVLVLGQASENDTRARLSAAQAESAAIAASEVTSAVNDRYENVRAALAGLALKPRPEESLVALAVQRGDTATLQLLADTLLYNPSVRRTFVAIRGDASTIADATVVVESPRVGVIVGQRLSEFVVSGAAVQAVVATTPAFETGAFTIAYPANASSPSKTDVIASISTSQAIVARTGAGLTTAPATIIVEIDNARLFADAAALRSDQATRRTWSRITAGSSVEDEDPSRSRCATSAPIRSSGSCRASRSCVRARQIRSAEAPA